MAVTGERYRLLVAAMACILLCGLAIDGGGFRPTSWNVALAVVCVFAVVVALLTRLARPGGAAGAFLVALAALAAWTALSYLWSASPWRALEEAQRVTLYFSVAAVVVLCARHLPVWAICGSATVVACWNLATRAHGIGHETGAGSEPIGYANGLALVCVLGIVLLPALPRLAWAAAIPLATVLVLQHSRGAYAALVVAGAVYLARSPRSRVLIVACGIVLMLVSPFVTSSSEREQYWRVAVREAHAHPVLGSGAGTFVNAWVRDRGVSVQTTEAHSLYVETLAELGPLGLALVLAVLAIPLAVTRRPELAAGVAAFAVAAAVDFDWELAGVTVPAVVLAALAVSSERAPSAAPARAVVPVAALVAVAALLAYAGNARLSRAQEAARSGHFAAAAGDARAATRWQPYSPAPWLVIGDVSSAPPARIAAYRRAIELDPADWSLWQRLATVATGRLRRLAEARAAQLNPRR